MDPTEWTNLNRSNEMSLLPNRDELYLAYRQAKATIYNDRRGVGLLNFARFERDLERNIDSLLTSLSVSSGWFDGLSTGQLWIAPKNVRHVEPDGDSRVIRIGVKGKAEEVRSLDVRALYSVDPALAIVEVLYLWRFGPAMESLLSSNSIGYRLDLRRGRLDPTRRWIFEYWPRRYEEYRTAPISAATRELQSGRSVVLISADLASFYDTIEPSFLLNDVFVSDLQTSADSSNRSFDVREYRIATDSLIRLYAKYRHLARRRTGLAWRTGIPIGTITSRLVANLALASFDATVEAASGVRSYRRYVDDFVVVVSADEDNLRASLGSVLTKYIPFLNEAKDGSHLRLDANELQRLGSEFSIQTKKCRVHHLEGPAGIGFLAEIAKGYSSLLSERRAFIDSAVLGEGDGSSLVRLSERIRQVTVLRDADRPKIEHFALGMRMNSLDRLSVLLNADEVRRVACPVIGEMLRYFEDERDWVECIDIAVRLLQLAIRIQAWTEARSLNDYLDSCFRDVEALKVRAPRLFHHNREIHRGNAWIWLRNFLHARRIEAVCRVIRVPGEKGSNRIYSSFIERTKNVGRRALLRNARLLAAADLRVLDREDDNFGPNLYDTDPGDLSFGSVDSSLRKRLMVVDQFVRRSDAIPWDVDRATLFLCTRPPTYFDVSRRYLVQQADAGVTPNTFPRMLELVNAIRGTQYSEPDEVVVDDLTVQFHQSDSLRREHRDPQIILGNLVVSESSYGSSLEGQPVLTVERLRGLHDILRNTRTRASRYNGYSLLILPELSLPRRWFRDIAYFVRSRNEFGVIVGLEYQKEDSTVRNEAWTVLPSGWHKATSWVWTKRRPARHEEFELNQRGLSFPCSQKSPGARRVAIDSSYGCFSVLICSELMEAGQVADLFGRIEILVVPSWNKDTASYDHLIQSVGLQLHTIVAIANNGHYSDCRVWAPRDVRWQRDQCRLIERDVNDVLSVAIPLQSLREFRTLDSAREMVQKGSSDQDEWRILPPGWPANP